MNHTVTGVSAAALSERTRIKLDGVSRSYDPRVCAIRADLADVALADLYFAPHYVAPVSRSCAVPSVMLRGLPKAESSAVTELLYGEVFQMLEARAGWAWGYCGHDHYVGYVPLEALGETMEVTHSTVMAAPVFTTADIKSPVRMMLPAGAGVSGAVEGVFLATAEGFIHVRHLRAPQANEADWVAVAERHLGMAYVWGGRGGLGIDCAGLVQIALAACGIPVPRDTDQQIGVIGDVLVDDVALRRGDIIFFPGHVGLMVDEARLIHANAFAMAVTIEPLTDVVARLADTHEKPVTARRRITP